MKCQWKKEVTNGVWEEPFEVEKMHDNYGLFIFIFGIESLRGEDLKHSQEYKDFETNWVNKHKVGFDQEIGDQTIHVSSKNYLVKRPDGTFQTISKAFFEGFIEPVTN